MHTTPLTAALIPACATTGALAFEDDELFAFFRPNRRKYPGRLRDECVRMLHQRLNSPGVIVRVMVSDDTDEWWDDRIGSEVLGYAVWIRVGEGRKTEFWGRDGWVKRFERYAVMAQMQYMRLFRLDPSLDLSHLKAYENVMSTQNPADKALEEHEEHLWLGFLGTHPKYQRKGVGRRLVRWGVNRANAEGIPIGLIASPNGAGLYESFDFQDVGLCVLDFDGTRLEDRTMIRWPDMEDMGRKYPSTKC